MDDQPDDLTAEVTFDGDTTAIVLVTGEIDVETSAILTRATHDAVANGAVRLILDMSGVTFLDSSGIAALIDTRSIARFTLRQPSEVVRRLIVITGLTETFEIEP